MQSSGIHLGIRDTRYAIRNKFIYPARSPFELYCRAHNAPCQRQEPSIKTRCSHTYGTTPPTLTFNMATAESPYELQNLDNTSPSSGYGIHIEHDSPDQTLPPVDGGLQAWRVLLAAFMFEAVLWGFPLSFGIFQEYYSSLPEFEGSPFITYIGSIATGIVYMGAPLMAPLVKKFPMYQRHMVVAALQVWWRAVLRTP
jgi:hypothetical protein